MSERSRNAGLACPADRTGLPGRSTGPVRKTLVRQVLVRLVFAGTAMASLGTMPAFAAELKLNRVMLSSGGVGYFEYEAEVKDSERLTFDVPLAQVDDVLKSVVVYDDKGGVGGLSLPGREPLDQLFRDLPFDANDLTSPTALLNALKGAQVQATGARTLSGRLLSVEPVTEQLGNDRGTVVRNRVTLMTEAGIQQMLLEDAQALQFTDPAVQRQVEGALAGIAANKARDKRTITVESRGEGTRMVRVGYVVGTPLWKSAYRLTVGADAEADKARLQGWAVVENMSGKDWEGVELTLVSGSPVTFRQQLYAAYYLDRPEVPVEVVGRILPPADKGEMAAGLGALGGGDYEQGAMNRSRAAMLAVPPPPPPPPPAPAAPMAEAYDSAGFSPITQAAPVGMAGGATAVAGEEAQTQVQFRLTQPINVSSGESLAVPIIDRDVPAGRLALYTASVSSRHPLAGVRLSNDGETGLPPGVLTLYERSAAGAHAFLGDARLAAFPAGEERMVTFALDTKVVLDKTQSSTSRIAEGKIANGLFRYRSIDRSTTTYAVQAPAREARRLVIEHPRDPSLTLVEPKGDDVALTDGAWRITVPLKAGETKQVAIVTERPIEQYVDLNTASQGQIAYFANSDEIDAEVRKVFAKLAELQTAVTDAQAELSRLESDRSGIVQEQERLRSNMESVPRDTDLYRRYLTKMDEQETRIEQLQTSAAEAEAKVDAATKALSAYVLSVK